MESKRAAITAYIQEIKSLRQNEDKILEYIMSIVNSHPIEIVDDEITRTFGAPLALCDGCKHWNNSICDMIHFGCHFEIKR